MADLKRYIEIIFSAQDDAGPVIKNLGQDLKNTASTLDTVLSPAVAVTEAVLAFEAALIAGGIALTAFAVQAAGEFDTSFREISTVIHASEEDMIAFRDVVLDAAGQSSGSFDSFTKSVYDAISAGIQYKDSVDLVAQAEKLSIGGRADLAETTKLLVTSMNTYGVTADQAATFSDILFKTVEVGITTIPELAASLGQVTPTANAAGLSFAELNAVIGVLTQNGIGTSQAVTGLKAALSNIIKPTADAQEVAEKLGINFSVTALQSQGLASFMATLADKTNGNVETMGKLFGSTEALNAVMVLTKGGADQLANAIEANKNSAGATEEAFRKMADSMEVSTAKLKNAFQALAITIGDDLAGPFVLVQQAMTNMFNEIRQAAEGGAFDPLTNLVVDTLTIIANLFNQLATNIEAALQKVNFQPLVDAITQLRDQFLDGLGIEETVGDANSLASAIQTLVNILTGFTNFTTGVVQSFRFIKDAIAFVIPDSLSLNGNFAQLAGSIGGMTLAINLAIPIVKLLGSAFTNVGDLIISSGGILNNIYKLGGAVASLATGPVGIGIAAAGLLYFADQSLNGGAATQFITDKLQAAGEALGIIAPRSAEAADGLGDMGFQMGALVGSASDFASNLGSASDEVSGIIPLSRELFPLLYDNAQAMGNISASSIEWSEATGQIGEILSNTVSEIESYRKSLGDTYNANILASHGFFAVKDATGEYYSNITPLAGALSQDLNPKLDDTAEKTKKAAEDAEKLALEWEKLASQERQILLQVQSDIAVAQIQAQAAQVVAAFESIGQTVQSTGELIGNLANAFLDANTSFEQNEILKLLQQEQENRQQALDLQKQLTEAQIKVLEAQAARLNNGEAFITITADGLEPELEAIMFKILERIQVKAAADAQQFLLGV